MSLNTPILSLNNMIARKHTRTKRLMQLKACQIIGYRSICDLVCSKIHLNIGGGIFLQSCGKRLENCALHYLLQSEPILMQSWSFLW